MGITNTFLLFSHLLEKIRSMGEAAQKRNETGPDGTQYPNPIKRRLLF